MDILTRYLPKTDYDNYEDFCKNFEILVPEDFDFARDVVDEWAKIEPSKTALIYCDDDGNERIYSFSEIALQSKKAASYFKSIGIKSGDRVLTLLRRRYEYWICAVALHRLGAVLVPASIMLTKKDVKYRVNASKAKMILAINDNFVVTQLDNITKECPSLREIIIVGDNAHKGYKFFNEEYNTFEPFEEYSGLNNGDEMLIYFTSGTSGMPKMAVHNRTYPLGHIVTAKFMQCVQNGGLHLTQADSGWAKFGWGNIYGQWLCGSAILGYDPLRFDSKNLMTIMEKYKPTSLCIPPTMYRFLLRDGLKNEHVKSIKWYSTAGEPLSGEVNSTFYDLTGHFIHEGFGQSEGTPITCSFQWLDIRPSSMGKPSPLYNTAIIRADGTKCDIGEEGEIVLIVKDKKQIGLLDYYLTDGERQYAVIDGVYHTGDTAYEDEGGYYWYVGRNDDMIKCSGYRIGPFEIESVMNSHPAVRESAIVGYPDELRGQVVCAIVALNEGYEKSDELTLELQKYVKQNTAPYKYPRRIEYIKELPKTTSGKIIRNKVRQMINK